VTSDFKTFLDLDPQKHQLGTSFAAILPVSYSKTVSFKSGTELGPVAIIEASAEMEDYDSELDFETCTLGIHTLPFLDSNLDDPAAMSHLVASKIDELHQEVPLICMIGGEHSLSAGAVESFSRNVTDLSVLVFDAQADLRNEYQGWEYSHACTSRRIMDFSPVSLVGVRSLTSDEMVYIQESKIPFCPRNSEPIESIDSIIDSLSSNVYISIDLDVLDPSIMSAVGTPEPGGMGWWEILHLLRSVSEQKNIVGFDVMELAPNEGPTACAYTAAKLVYKMIGYSSQKLRRKPTRNLLAN